MPLSVTEPNLGESRIKVLKAGIVANISTLDAICSRDSLLPGGTIIGDLVMIGDPKTMPAVADAPVLICVVGGGQRDGRDFEAKALYSGMPTDGVASQWYTNFFLYVHQDLFAAADNAWVNVKAQIEKREDLRARMCDFIRGIFNRAPDVPTNTGCKITLTSRERATAPDFDKFDMALVTDGYKGEFEKSFGANQSLFGAHLIHIGSVGFAGRL